LLRNENCLFFHDQSRNIRIKENSLKMPPKTKKSKKAEEAEELDSDITAVDRQFFELQIADLNKKLTRLRAHNVKIEEKNDELESKMKQIEDDRQDVSA
jgi:predicted  nucleic acid-binding Zn-ribbon protein